MLPPGAVKPDYTGYCLSNVPTTAQSILGVDPGRPVLPDDALGATDTSGIDNVVLILCDGLGYREMERHDDRGFLGALWKKGSVRPITTVFPSTTAAAISTVSTGLTPQEHGLPEWFVYLDEIGEVIVSLPFTRAGEYGRDTLLKELSPKTLLQGRTVFQRLESAGVRCTSLTSRGLAHSAYSTVSRSGSEVFPYISSSDMSTALRRLVEGAKGPSFFYVYWSMVDTIEHSYGPNTDEAGVEAGLVSQALAEGFLSKLDRGVAKRTLILLTADHGQLNVDPKKTLYLNRFKTLTNNLQRSPAGKMIPPWGSARDLFMRVKEERLEETKRYLAEKLGGNATVLETEDAVAAGLFGINKPTRRFRRRTGNLMVLPHGESTVWYKYGKDSLDLRGHHGGLMEDEMTIPLASGRASDLQ